MLSTKLLVKRRSRILMQRKVEVRCLPTGVRLLGDMISPRYFMCMPRSLFVCDINVRLIENYKGQRTRYLTPSVSSTV